jgi:hypothetical protein
LYAHRGSVAFAGCVYRFRGFQQNFPKDSSDARVLG